jgi:sugar-specific transcriptional regulator TrmB
MPTDAEKIAELNDQIGQMVIDHAEEITELNQEHEDEITDLKTEHETEIEELRDELDGVENTQEETKSSLTDVIETLKEILSNLK